VANTDQQKLRVARRSHSHACGSSESARPPAWFSYKAIPILSVLPDRQKEMAQAFHLQLPYTFFTRFFMLWTLHFESGVIEGINHGLALCHKGCGIHQTSNPYSLVLQPQMCLQHVKWPLDHHLQYSYLELVLDASSVIEQRSMALQSGP
jgi:hypothetical protein